MKAKIPITVVIPVKNEAAQIGECIKHLSRFEAILVVDSHSIDETASIAGGLGAEVVQFSWNGALPKKRNWILKNHCFTTDWVLFLDADERVTEAFCDEVEDAIRDSGVVGFRILYRNYFLGKQLNYGEPNQKLALIKVGTGFYEEVQLKTQGDLDMEVHEHPLLNGKVETIKAKLEHLDRRGFSAWLRKHNEYSSWEAERLARYRNDNHPRRVVLGARQRFKYNVIGRAWFPLAYFIAIYVVKQGFRDGYPGFVYAASKSIYFWQVGVKYRSQGWNNGTAVGK